MTFIAAIIGFAMILGVGWFALQAQRGRSGWATLKASLKRLRRAEDDPALDETFAHQVTADQDARDKGAV
jgi:hypothetical protein